MDSKSKALFNQIDLRGHLNSINLSMNHFTKPYFNDAQE